MIRSWPWLEKGGKGQTRKGAMEEAGCSKWSSLVPPLGREKARRVSADLTAGLSPSGSSEPNWSTVRLGSPSPTPSTASNSSQRVSRTKSDSTTAVRSRSVSQYDRSWPMQRLAKLSVPERIRSKSWDAALGGFDSSWADRLKRQPSQRSSKRKRPLASQCLHCRYLYELKKNRVTAEMGKAVQSLAQGMEVSISSVSERRQRRISLQPTSTAATTVPLTSRPLRATIHKDATANPPDIVVSSVSSDEDIANTSQDISLDEPDEALVRDLAESEASTSASSTSTSPSDLTGDSDDSLGQLGQLGGGVEGIAIPAIAISNASSAAMPDLRQDGVLIGRAERSASIATAASEADTLIFQASPSPDALSSHPGSPLPPDTPTPTSPIPPTILEEQHYSPPLPVDTSPPGSPLLPMAPSVEFAGILGALSDEPGSFLGTAIERPILDSISSGKASCSCLPPGCLRPLLHRDKAKAKGHRDSLSSGLLSTYSVFTSSPDPSFPSVSDASSIFLEAPSVASQRSSSIDLPTLSRDIQLLSSADDGQLSLSPSLLLLLPVSHSRQTTDPSQMYAPLCLPFCFGFSSCTVKWRSEVVGVVSE